MEANTLAQFYKQVGFHEIQPLAADYEEFLKYGQGKSDAAAVKKTDAGAEPDVEKAAEAAVSRVSGYSNHLEPKKAPACKRCSTRF